MRNISKINYKPILFILMNTSNKDFLNPCFLFRIITKLTHRIIIGDFMRLCTFFICLMFTFSPVQPVSYPCKSSIIIKQGTNEIIEGKNIYATQSVASISKIMTAIIAIENLNVLEEIKINHHVSKAYGSSVYLKEGDTITILDLLYGLMLRSGNDCAIVLESLIVDFVDLMNKKAKELNMNYTKFQNTSGLDQEDGGNISCVYDMAILMSYAMNHELFRQIVGCEKYERLDGNGYWTNKNKLLFNYDLCIGGKTGYTKKAGRTLVTCASNGDFDLICVTFRCPEDFEYHENLYKLYFKKYQYFFDLDTF